MPEETVYSSEPALGSPRRFFADAAAELRVVPATAWRVWRRGLQARYRQSRLGYLWLVVPPMAFALAWVYLDHVRVVSFGDPGIPYAAYVLGGMLLWQAFSDALQSPLRRLAQARVVLTKTRLPHETWLLAGVLDALFGFVVRFAVTAVVLAALGIDLRPEVLLVPLGVLAIVALGFAIGLALAPLGLLYDDVGEAIAALIGLWFFLTPVVYPWPLDGTVATIIELNPVTPLLVTTRAWLTGAPGAEPVHSAIVVACTLVVLAVGWLLYRLSRPHLVARL